MKRETDIFRPDAGIRLMLHCMYYAGDQTSFSQDYRPNFALVLGKKTNVESVCGSSHASNYREAP